MQAKTKARLNGNDSRNLHAYCAFRAIMRAVGRTGMPAAYHTDLAIDADLLYQRSHNLRFVFCLRRCGTRLFWPGEGDRLEGEAKVFGVECHFYTYDEDVLANGWDEEPELVACNYEEAIAFLVPRRDQARYLAPDEMLRVAAITGGRHADLAMYLQDTRSHPPGNGLCLEVWLTSNEAVVVDEACRLLGIE